MPMTVRYPTGQQFEFPDGTDQAAIDAHYASVTGGGAAPAAPQRSPIASAVNSVLSAFRQPSNEPQPTMPDLAGTNFAFAAPGTVDKLMAVQQQSNQDMMHQRVAQQEQLRVETENEKGRQQQIKLETIRFQNDQKIKKLEMDRQKLKDDADIQATKDKASADAEQKRLDRESREKIAQARLDAKGAGGGAGKTYRQVSNVTMQDGTPGTRIVVYGADGTIISDNVTRAPEGVQKDPARDDQGNELVSSVTESEVFTPTGPGLDGTGSPPLGTGNTTTERTTKTLTKAQAEAEKKYMTDRDNYVMGVVAAERKNTVGNAKFDATAVSRAAASEYDQVHFGDGSDVPDAVIVGWETRVDPTTGRRYKVAPWPGKDGGVIGVEIKSQGKP